MAFGVFILKFIIGFMNTTHQLSNAMESDKENILLNNNQPLSYV